MPLTRLGPNGENITYRGAVACPVCGRTEKHFDNTDLQQIQSLSAISADPIFDTVLIENSRINLTGPFIVYGNLFPHRSKLALIEIWRSINALTCSTETIMFLQDAFLSIIPQAKYKDYRSKSQDLHCPDIQLREVNIFYRFFEQLDRRQERLAQYPFSRENSPHSRLPIQCKDFRDFMASVANESTDLVFTDPPWLDGNAYFEKAQLYHPWLNYNLRNDHNRLEKEFVITDAPSRPEHNEQRWWQDMAQFFLDSRRVLKTNGFLALFFRPIPANHWLTNLNKLKLVARQNGFEPLLSIDVGSSDPSMRVQQSASYVFSRDIVFVFLKLEPSVTRTYSGNHDIDQIVFQTAEGLQETLYGPFTYQQWRQTIANRFNELGLNDFNLPDKEELLLKLFNRYCDQISPGQFLPKLNTPFSGQLFDIPAIERLFTYVPHVINSLTAIDEQFTYDQFLLSLSTFVENGTRSLINQIEELDMRSIISPYAEPVQGCRFFKKRSIPQISVPIQKIMELDPYQFEEFIGQLLRALGFTNVAIIGRAGDRGVDLVADDPDQRKTVVQCKRYIGHSVSATPVQRLHSFAITRNATRKILITTSDFTPQAKEEASITQTETINGEQLENLVAQHMSNSL